MATGSTPRCGSTAASCASSAPAEPPAMGNQLRLMIPTMISTASVPTTETRIEPRQPRRLEKKTNTAGRYPAPGSGTRRLVEMLQHVSLEVPPDEVERMIEFWR